MKILGLDVGGVLLRSPWELLSEQYPYFNTLLPNVLGPLSGGCDYFYAAYQAGHMSETAYWRYFSCSLIQQTAEFRELENPVRALISMSADPVRPSILQWLIEFCSDGGKVLSFSNGLYRNMGKAWVDANLPMGLIAKHYDASETMIHKPDRRSFDPLLKEADRCPDSVVLYVDDNPLYVAAAREAGLRGAIFSVAEQERSISAISSFFRSHRADG